MSTIKARVIDVIMTELGIPETTIKDESRIVDDLGADSLDVVQISMSLEEEFDFSISDEDVEKLKTVSSIVEFIEKKIKEKEAKNES